MKKQYVMNDDSTFEDQLMNSFNEYESKPEIEEDNSEELYNKAFEVKKSRAKLKKGLSKEMMDDVELEEFMMSDPE